MAQATPNAIVVYSTVWCRDCKRAKQFFGDQRVPFINVGVDIVERNPVVKASRLAQNKVAEQSNMTVLPNHAVREFKGRQRLEAVVVQDRATGALKEWHYDGVFVFIGLSPNTDLVRGQVETDDQGFIVTDKTLMTSLSDLFVAGDVRAGSTKQAASAAGEGATAALMIREYLKEVA